MTTFKLHSEALQPQWLDAYGHLNEAYYLLPFTNTTWKLQDEFGIGVDYFEQTGCALYTVETHLRYLQEVRAPAQLQIETIILGADAKKIWFAHTMLVEGVACASAEFLVLHYSTRDARTIAMPESVQARLQQSVVSPLPDWVGAHIRLQRR